MIYFFSLLLLIPLYIRFKGSDELIENKFFALFLIWFSRIIAFFLLFHIVEHFGQGYGLYTLPAFLFHSFYRGYKERIFFKHTYKPSKINKPFPKNTEQTAITMNS